MVKSSNPNVPSTWLIFFGPILTLPRRTGLHSASSVLAVRISCCVIGVSAVGLWKYYPWTRCTLIYIFFLKQAAIAVLSKLRILGTLPPLSHVYMARCSVDCRQLLGLLCPSFPDFEAQTRRHQKQWDRMCLISIICLNKLRCVCCCIVCWQNADTFG
jgi:hypothetical protein